MVASVHYYRQEVSGERYARELFIGAIAVGGLVLFWRDMQRCAMYEGILKLVAIVGLANILIPCLWLVPPPPPPPEVEEEEGHA